MERNENDPTAQGQQAAAETQNGESNQQAQVSPGVQARIDELVRKQHEMESRFSAELRAKDEFIQNLMIQTAGGGQGGQQQPAVDIDPDLQKQIEAVTQPYIKRLEQVMQRVESGLGQQQIRAFGNGEDPRVVQRAEALLVGWRKAGLQFSPEDALTFARGEIAKADASKNNQSRNARGQFNALSESVITHQGGQTQNPAPRGNDALPQDFDSLSPSKQLEILEKRLDGKTF